MYQKVTPFWFTAQPQEQAGQQSLSHKRPVPTYMSLLPTVRRPRDFIISRALV